MSKKNKEFDDEVILVKWEKNKKLVFWDIWWKLKSLLSKSKSDLQPMEVLNNFLENPNKYNKKQINILIKNISNEEFANLIINKIIFTFWLDEKQFSQTSRVEKLSDFLIYISLLENISKDILIKILYNNHISLEIKNKWRNRILPLYEKYKNENLQLPMWLLDFIESDNSNPSKKLRISWKSTNLQSLKISKYEKLAQENKI